MTDREILHNLYLLKAVRNNERHYERIFTSITDELRRRVENPPEAATATREKERNTP